jgi:hypothetical protein
VINVDTFDEKLRRYMSNYLQKVTRINNEMPKVIPNYTANERRSFERPIM